MPLSSLPPGFKPVAGGPLSELPPGFQPVAQGPLAELPPGFQPVEAVPNPPPGPMTGGIPVPRPPAPPVPVMLQTEEQQIQRANEAVSTPEMQAKAKAWGNVQKLAPPESTLEDLKSTASMYGLGLAGKAPALFESVAARRAAAGAANALGGFFSYQMAKGGLEQYKEAADAYQKGDYLGAVRYLGSGSLEAGLGLLGLREAARGGTIFEPKAAYEARKAAEPSPSAEEVPSPRALPAGPPPEPPAVGKPLAELPPGFKPVEPTPAPAAPLSELPAGFQIYQVPSAEMQPVRQAVGSKLGGMLAAPDFANDKEYQKLKAEMQNAQPDTAAWHAAYDKFIQHTDKMLTAAQLPPPAPVSQAEIEALAIPTTTDEGEFEKAMAAHNQQLLAERGPVPPTRISEAPLAQPPLHAPSLAAVSEVIQGEPAPIRPVDPLHVGISQRRTVFHATDLGGLQGITKAGEIRPTMGTYDEEMFQDVAQAYLSPEEFKQFSGLSEFKEHLTPEGERALAKLVRTVYSRMPEGVSVSRVPRVATKSSKAISLVLDAGKVPSSRPLAEQGYEKTVAGTVNWEPYATSEETQFLDNIWRQTAAIQTAPEYKSLEPSGDHLTPEGRNKFDQLRKQADRLIDRISRRAPVNLNPHYEFEDRTYRKPIPLSAAREVWIDKAAVPPIRITGELADKLAKKMFNKKSGSDLSPWEWSQIADHDPEELAHAHGFETPWDKTMAAAKATGLPIRVFENGKEMHRARVEYGREAAQERARLESIPSQFRVQKLELRQEKRMAREAFAKLLGGTQLTKEQAQAVFQEQYQKAYHQFLDKVYAMTVAEAFPNLADEFAPGTTVFKAFRNLPPDAQNMITPDAWLTSLGIDLSVPVEIPSQVAYQAAGAEMTLDKLFAGIPPEPPEGEGGAPGALSPEERRGISADMVKFGWFREWVTTLLQIGYDNPWFTPLQEYLTAWRGRTHTKAEIGLRGNARIHQLLDLGKTRLTKVFDLAFALDDLSFRKKKRFSFTDKEVRDLVTSKKIDEETFKAYRDMDSDFREFLLHLKSGLVEEAFHQIQDVTIRADKIRKIEEQFAKLEERNYFPHSRFGRYTVTVRAVQNGVKFEGKTFRKDAKVAVFFEEFYYNQLKRAREMKKLFGNKVKIVNDVLDDNAFSFQGFPPALVESMRKDLNLTEEQNKRLDAIIMDSAPGQSFIHHLKRRYNIKGFSHDGLRAYASFVRSAATHIANLEWRNELQRTIGEANKLVDGMKYTGQPGEIQRINSARNLADFMKRNYDHMMNPGNELSMIRGLAFTGWFAFVPKHVFINLTQVPLLGWPHLSAIISTKGVANPVSAAKAAAHLARAMKDVATQFDKASLVLPTREGFTNTGLGTDDTRALMDMLKAGVIKEGMATELGAFAAGSLFRMFPANNGEIEYYFRRMAELGTKHFGLAEEFNRRSMGLATYRAFREMGKDHAAAVQEAIRAVDVTQGNYDPANKPRLMWGKRSLFFIFKSYAQFVARFFLMEKGNLFGLFLSLLIGGVSGVPFAQDAINLLSGVLTRGKKAFHMKEPLTKVEDHIRHTAVRVGLDPELVVNGISRKSFYFPFVPQVDFSPSLSQGKIIPGVALLEKVLEGNLDYKEFGNAMAQEFLGVVGSQGVEAARAMADANTPVWQPLAPKSVLNVGKAVDMLQTGQATTRAGRPLGPVTKGEAVGQLMGLSPTHIVETAEDRYRKAEYKAYYDAWRENAISNFARAKPDREALADAIKNVTLFNKTAPVGYAITGDQLAKARIHYLQTNAKLEAGVPLSKRSAHIEQWVHQGYPDLAKPRQPSSR